MKFMGIQKNFMIIIVVLFCFGCESPTNPSPANTKPAQAKSTESANKTDKLTVPKKYEAYEIKKWTGEGIKSTEMFHIPPGIPSNEWVIFWVSRPIHKSGGILQIYVYRSDGTLVDIVANVTGKNDDRTVMRSGPGDYYLKINSANVVYVVVAYVIREVK
jgi:hypothetical protein